MVTGTRQRRSRFVAGFAPRPDGLHPRSAVPFLYFMKHRSHLPFLVGKVVVVVVASDSLPHGSIKTVSPFVTWEERGAETGANPNRDLNMGRHQGGPNPV